MKLKTLKDIEFGRNEKEDVRKLSQAINRLQKQKEDWKRINLRKLDELLKDFKHKLKRNYEPISYERLKEMVEKKSELDKFFVFDVRLSDLNKLLEELTEENLK